MNKKILCLVIASLFCNYSPADPSVRAVKVMASMPAFLVPWEAFNRSSLCNVDFQKDLIRPLQTVQDQGCCSCKMFHKNKAKASATSSQSKAAREIENKKIKASNKLLIKTFKNLGEVLKKNSDIDFLFVMDIDKTLVHSVENENAHNQQQEWLLRLDKLARQNNNFILVYNTARPMEIDDSLVLSFEEQVPVESGDVYWFRNYQNMLWLPLAEAKDDDEEALPEQIGIPVPDAIISNLGMVFQVNPSLIKKTPFLKENIKELNQQLLELAKKSTEPLINEIRRFKNECREWNEWKNVKLILNSRVYNPAVVLKSEVMKNEWMSRMPSPNTKMLNFLLKPEGRTIGITLHSLYLINKGTGLRIAIGLLRKAGRIKESKKTMLISFGDSHHDLPFLIPNEEVSSLGEDDYTSEAKQEREQNIRTISEATTINIPSLDMTSSLYTEDDSLTWFMSVVFHVGGLGDMYHLKNEAIDKSLAHEKLVHVAGASPDSLVNGIKRVVERLKEHFNQ